MNNHYSVHPFTLFCIDLSVYLHCTYLTFVLVTDPEQFIYSHFPMDKKWQLLARTVTLDEAKDMVLLKRNFFSIGMDVVSHPQYAVDCKDGEVQITFSTSPDIRVKFQYELFIQSKDLENLPKTQLQRYVFLERVTRKNMVNVCMRFPVAAKYKLKILAKEQNEKSLYYTCEYIIDCFKPIENCIPLPLNERGEWGPGIDTEEIGLKPITHDFGKVSAEDGKAEVRFNMSKHVEFQHKLVTLDNEELPNRVMHRVQDSEVVFNIRPPKKGIYAFNVYAREIGEKGEYPNVCNYLLKCEEEPKDKQAFPNIGADRLGPTEAFHEFGMRNIYLMPALMLEHITGELTQSFNLSKKAIFISELLLHNDDGSKTNFSEYTMWEIVNGVATFFITFPRVGWYSLVILAKLQEGSQSFTPVFRSIIDALIPKKQCLPYPQQTFDWPVDCHVIKPLSGVISAREKISFEIEFPLAKDLIATSVNGSKLLEMSQNGIWKGSIAAGNEDSVVTISARYSDVEEYQLILTYKVKDLLDVRGGIGNIRNTS